ncbi:MAG: YceI family protein [Cellvibrionales bacterium]|nr:YceI family protein [Cellvibrionales bacterium]
MKSLKLWLAALPLVLFTQLSQAASYVIDTQGAHAFINFKIQHLGYSWLTGRFNTFEGSFDYDAKAPEKSKIEVLIQTNSIDSNHAERDKHLKGKGFLDVHKYPTAKFVSTKYTPKDTETGTLTGEFTLHGITKTIKIDVKKIGEGADPWGGYRVGFEGTTRIKLTDYGITYNLGPKSTHVDLELLIEGIRK